MRYDNITYYKIMQENNLKTEELADVLGQLIKDLRRNISQSSLDNLAISFGISKGSLSNIENGTNNVKFVTLWKLSEALGIRCSDLVKLLEERLGEEFTLLDD